MKRIFLLLTLTFLLFACNSIYKENIESAEEAMKSGDFESALEFYTIALDEEPSDSDVKAKVDLLTDYESLQTAIETNEWTEASDLANKVLKNEAIIPILKTEVKEQLATIDEEQAIEKDVANELEKIERLIDEDDVDTARIELDALELDLDSNTLSDEIGNMYKKLSKAENRVAKYEAEKQDAIDTEKELAKDAEDKAKQEAERKAAEQPATSSNLYTKYLNKANDLESKRIKDDFQNGYLIQIEEWDNLLNDVWAELEDTMPKSEFKTLKVEQKEWIDEKEATFDEMPDGHASEREEAASLMVQKDANRTFYLIENYLE